jgi:hypothetical protein
MALTAGQMYDESIRVYRIAAVLSEIIADQDIVDIGTPSELADAIAAIQAAAAQAYAEVTAIVVARS